MSTSRRLLIVLSFTLIGSLLLAWPLTPTTAQEPLFATNTPRPESVPVLLLTPEAPLERYALRLWLEQDLLTVIQGQVQLLRPGDAERERAIRLLQYELQWRFPGAPRNAVRRQQLLQAMLAAPRGSVDMRNVVRLTVANWLNEVRPALGSAASYEQDGFLIEVTPANLDRIPPLDAMIHARYPADAEEPDDLIYEDYVLAQMDAQGTYRILNATPSFPAAPLGDIRSVRLERIGNLNDDGLDELAVSVQTSDVNERLEIYGWRNGEVLSLVEPGQGIQYGEILDWPRSSTTISVSQYRVESAAWGCLGEVPVDWTWNSNFFRPTVNPDGYAFLGSIACLLYGEEPFFDGPPQDSINTIQSILAVSTGEEDEPARRAAMIVAMLNYLDGREGIALETVQQLGASAEPGSWLAEQAAAFISAAEQPDSTPVQICAALQAASEYGACDVDQLLTRLFTDEPLRRDEPIEEQLSDMGISVLDLVTISEVGRFNRQAVHFNLAGDRWWQFAPLAADVYTAEKISAPPGFERALATPPAEVTPPAAAYDALMAQGDITSTLNVLNNVVLANPGARLSPAVRYLQALGYDLLADRVTARQSYLALWLDDTDTIWGQLAAAHLERR